MNKSHILPLVLLAAAAQVQAMSGGDGSSENPFQIGNCSDLGQIVNNLNASYILTADIDCQSVPFNTLHVPWADNNAHSYFTGLLDGRGHSIKNLNLQTVDKRTALIGQVSGGTIRNLTLENVTLAGSNETTSESGALVGNVHTSGSFSNILVRNATVSGGGNVGGIFGSFSGTAANVHGRNITLTGQASSSYRQGGFAGNSASGTIDRSSVTGAMYYDTNTTSRLQWAGGLVGYMDYTQVKDSFADVDMHFNTGTAVYVGGLVGYYKASWLTGLERVFSRGRINTYNASASSIGGLVGHNQGAISNAYSQVDISGNGFSYNSVGSLLGSDYSSRDVTNTYAIAQNPQTNTVKCMIGNVWNTPSLNDYSSHCVNNDAQGKQQATYTGFSFDLVWDITENAAMPTLKGFSNMLQIQ